MTPKRWHQIEQIFHTAAALDTGDRPSYVAAACGDDLSLRQEVESLLLGRRIPVGIMDAPLDRDVLRLLVSEERRAFIGHLIDHYRVVALLGAGGMGIVYLAEDTKLGRKVALKLLPAAVTEDDITVRRFQREARSASALNHPNIITIHEIGQVGTQHYIAMEFIQGETLRQQLHGTRLPVREVVDIGAQVASALAAAHHAGIVHRDIKPENVMLRDDGYVKVLDFGIALLNQEQSTVNAGASQASLTATSPHAGTAGYISPEQVRGEALDARADLFALGVVLYELLAGRRPFAGGDAAAMLRAIREDEPPPLTELRPGVPRLLEEIIERALRKDRNERYQSAGEMLTDLTRLKQQLDARVALNTSALDRSSRVGRAAPQLPQSSNRSMRLEMLAAVVRRHVNWFLVAGALAVLAITTHILMQGHAAVRTLDAILLAFAFACVFAYFVVRKLGAVVTTAIHHEGAFRGLQPFQEADRDRFFGRERDVAALHAMVARAGFRFGVLYGDSGAGKTSLLTAGLVPQLKGDGRLTLYCRSYRDPLSALIEECRNQTQTEPHEGERTINYLRRVISGCEGEFVVIYDQFEEFFVNFRTRAERETFTSFIAECHGDSDLPIKFLFALRSDFLYLISTEFDERIPEPLMGDKRYHLRTFNEEQAAGVISLSAQAANLPLTEALCRQVARDLADGDTVLPPELQIIGTQLQSRQIFTIEAYWRAGGKEQLVSSFLEDVIRDSGDEDAAQMLLRSLISDENTRLTLTLKEIARRTQRSPETCARLLKLFGESRLVSVIQEDDPWRYELMHEYLIDQINRVTGHVMDTAQRANRLLRQYLVDYSLDKSTRVPVGKVLFIRRYSDAAYREQARDLLRKSFRAGLLKVVALTLLISISTTLAAGWFSVSETWEGAALADGHTAAVRRAVFSPDGRLLVTAGEDSKVIVWDFSRRERLATLTDHKGWVNSLAFSPDGKWFATGSQDSTVIVWDGTQLRKTTILRDHHAGVAGIAFSPDSSLLATSASEGAGYRTIIWKVGTWEKISEIPEGFQELGAVLFTRDSSKLIFTQHSTGITWDAVTGRPAGKNLGVGWGLNWAATSPDGTRFVGIGSGGEVVFAAFPALDSSAIYPAHRDHGRAVTFSPEGRIVATGAENIILWDAATRTRIGRLEYTAIVWSLAFSPDGRWLVSTHGDGAVLLWDVAERERVANFNQHNEAVRAVAYSPDGKRLATASEDQSVIIWDVQRGTKEAVLLGHKTRVTAVAFSPDGNWLASTDQYGGLIRWNIERREPFWSIVFPNNWRPASYCVTVSPDGKFVANSNGVYESNTGNRVVDFYNLRERLYPWLHPQGIYGIAFSPDSRRLACAVAITHRVALLDTSTWQLADLVQTEGVDFLNISISPDSKHLITGDGQGGVRLWTTSPLRQEAILGYHSARVKSVAFSPDGRHAASAGDDQIISLWDVNTRRLLTHVGSHTSPVLAVAFSPDGRRLASGESDKSVRIYSRHRSLWGHRLD